MDETSASRSLEGHPAADFQDCVLFSSHLSKSVALQQSSVPKLLVAGLLTQFAMLEGPRIPCDLPPAPHNN